MRRRKSSCPDIEQRRQSLSASGRNSVKLDLYIEDNEIFTNGVVGNLGSGPVAPLSRHRTPSPTNISHHSPDRKASSTANIEDIAEEVLCLRLLSTRTRFRFGGLQIKVISPIFNLNKLFNVEFDQESQVSLIKSQHLSSDQATSCSLASLDPKLTNGNDYRSATINLEPDNEDIDPNINGNLPILNANLVLVEEQSHRTSPKQLHVSTHSLSKTPEESEPIELPVKVMSGVSETTSSGDNTSVKFDNVKVYANLDHTSLIDSIDLETKSLQNSKSSGKSKLSSMRRHTHYYCYIPTSMASQAATCSSSALSSEDITHNYSNNNRRMSAHTLRRYMAKKVSDTWHSAVRVKKILSDSLTMFK